MRKSHLIGGTRLAVIEDSHHMSLAEQPEQTTPHPR
jgi:hypothetical protein